MCQSHIDSIMLYSIARAAGIIALLCPSIFAAALPAAPVTPLSPEVPWKRNGLSDRVRRDNSNGYGHNCGSHGPKSRNCWSGDFDINTDMDLKWPDTGKTVKVKLLHQSFPLLLCTYIITTVQLRDHEHDSVTRWCCKADDGCQRPVSGTCKFWISLHCAFLTTPDHRSGLG